jgi:acyl-CoA synthetase (NDP forming)
VVDSTHAGVPVLDGVWSFLGGVRALFAYRDFLKRVPAALPEANPRIVSSWRKRLALACGAPLGEADALSLLEHFGVRTSRPIAVESAATAADAARQLGYPVVLKSAHPGLAHKTEQGGVVVSIRDESDLAAAYQDLWERLGPAALVAPMIEGEVELLLGARQDPQFGPIVVLGFGGILAETLRDAVFALPPFSPADARAYLDRLRLRPLLDGTRGKPAVNIDAFCESASCFSVLVHELKDSIADFDVNPVIANAAAAVAVDALVIPR